MRVIILLSIRYNVCACHGPVYHYITATAVHLIPVQHFITPASWLCDHRVVSLLDELSVRVLSVLQVCVLQVNEYSLKERFEMKYSWCRQTYTRYHIPGMLDACAHLTAVYPVQRVCLS